VAKILIIKLGALGDVVMATSLVQQIQRHHAHDDLWLLTAPAFLDIFNNWPGLHVVAFGRRKLGDSIKAICWIRRGTFARVYDLQSSERSAIMCALSGIPARVGNHPRYPYNIHPGDKYTGQSHIYERMLDVLRAAGINAVCAPPVLPLADKEKDFVMAWLGKNQLLNSPFVILHPGTSPQHPEKSWPGFLELALALKGSGYAVVWAGSNSEQKMNGEYSRQVGIDASNIFSINMLAELGRYACFAVTNDSGPMHVLSGSGIPVYAFFGPTNWHRNHALGQKDHVLAVETLCPDHIPGASSVSDLRLITVNDVMRRLRKHGLVRS
jgi:ADP-heptose:LPS heptosyltransferase